MLKQERELMEQKKRQPESEDDVPQIESTLAESIPLFQIKCLFFYLLRFVSMTDLSTLRLVCKYFNKCILEKYGLFDKIQQNLRVTAIEIQKSDLEPLELQENEILLLYQVSLLLKTYYESLFIESDELRREDLSGYVTGINTSCSANRVIQEMLGLCKKKQSLHTNTFCLEYLHALVDTFYHVFCFVEVEFAASFVRPSNENQQPLFLEKLISFAQEERYRLIYWDLLLIDLVLHKFLGDSNFEISPIFDMKYMGWLEKEEINLPEEKLYNNFVMKLKDTAHQFTVYDQVRLHQLFLKMSGDIRHVFSLQLALSCDRNGIQNATEKKSQSFLTFSMFGNSKDQSLQQGCVDIKGLFRKSL